MSRPRRSCLSAVVALLLAAIVAKPAAAQIDILSGKPFNTAAAGQPSAGTPETIVSVHAEWTPATSQRPARLSVTADIEPPWHTYAITQPPVLATPTEIKLNDSPDYRVAGDFRPTQPAETELKDGHTFEIHSGRVTWQAPLEISAGVDPATLRIAGSARIQVCDDQNCHRPTQFDFVAQLAQPKPAPSSPPATNGIYEPQKVHAVLRGHLEPRSVTPGSTVNLVITAEPANGWHVYEYRQRDTRDLGYKPTLIVLTNNQGFRAGQPKASEKVIEAASEVPNGPPQRYHSGRVTWQTPITIPADTKPGQYPIEGLVGFQVCSGSTCDMPSAARFEGTITVGSAVNKQPAPLAFSEARYIAAAKAADDRPMASSAAVNEPVAAESSLMLILVFSVLGGFVLNFMPCVLPVIGLKILSFAEQAGRSRAQTLALNIWYSLGTLAVFMVLATLSAAVKLGLSDNSLGWGEQFSSTSFNVTMVAIVFVFSLSFLGVWEIPIPGFVGSGAAANVAAHEGAIGAFVKGALTTVLATPCSGPALGPVFGYTLKQPPAITFLIFGCIGLGMCSPYLIIGAFPKLIRFLPKPGAWMDTFKQMMGFLMLGTIVFFFSFMNRDYLVPTFAMMIGLWAGVWWIGRVSLVEPLKRKLTAWGQGAAFAAVVGWSAFTWLGPHESIIRWQPFSRAELAKLTSEGKTVMVEFTANWCANCKVNMFVAIETADVRDKLVKDNVVPMLADWSDGSAEIKNVLNSLNRNNIPLLVVFPAGKPSEPILLDGLLTKKNVLEAIEKAGPSRVASSSGPSLTASKP